MYYGNPKTLESLDGLSRKVSLSLDQQPLSAVVGQLRTRYKLDVRLDLDGLKEAQVPADSPVTLRVHDISLRSALSLMLREPDLRFTVTGSGLSITSREAAQSRWMLAAYPVGDLAGSRARPGLMAPGEVADLMAANCPVWDWSAEGGLGALELISLDGEYVVVVGHSFDTHDEISGLLYLLRDLAKKAATSGGVLTGVRCFDLPGQEAAHGTITTSLAKKISLACVDEPLTDVAARLAKLSGVNVVLDRRALSTAGFRDDMPITFIAEDLDLRSVMGKVCHVKGMAWEIRNGVLLITTAEVAETRRPLLAYSLPDTDAKTLRRVVVSTVYPIDWDDIGGDGVAAAVQLGKTGLLLVGQKEKAQREVAELFAILRKIADDTAAGRPAIRYGWDFPDGSPREPMAEVLSKRVTLDFDKRPLGEALRTFNKSYGLVVILDSKAPDVHAASRQRSVTIHVKDVPLGLALDEMLRALGLGWMLRDGTVVITTPKEAGNLLTTVFYPVADLVVCRDAGGRRWDDFDTLIRAIKSGVAPDSWAEPAGVGSIDAFGFGKARVLVVSQTEPVKYRIADWLAKTRTARKRDGLR